MFFVAQQRERERRNVIIPSLVSLRPPTTNQKRESLYVVESGVSVAAVAY